MPNRARILVVENDRSALLGLFAALTDAGFSVVTAEDGAQAVDLLERGIPPAVIMLDLMLPKVSGWEVLKHLRADPELREIPVIVMTGMERAEARAIADVVLQKPISLPELIAAAQRLAYPSSAT